MRIQTSFFGTLTLAMLAFSPLAAHAEEVSTTGKGIVGGALLGSEIVLVTEAAFKVQPTWAYLVGGLGGAAAGAVGGHFIEDSANSKTTMLMLAGGMAFAIPTTVAVLSATAYEPPASYTQDRAPADEPVAEPPQPSGTATPAPAPGITSPAGTVVTPPPAPVTTPPAASPPAASPPPATPTGSVRPRGRGALAHRTLPLDYHLSPPSLIGISSQALTLSVPVVELRDVYSRIEVATFGVRQGTEVRVPVLNLMF